VKILYVSGLYHGSTSLQRLNIMRELGHTVQAIDFEPGIHTSRLRALLAKINAKTGYILDIPRVNSKILKAVKTFAPDLIWIDKGLCVDPKTLIRARELKKDIVIACYFPDDITKKENQSRYYLGAVPLYDIHFINRYENVNDLKLIGAKRAVRIFKGFDPHTHKPMQVSREEKLLYGCDVGFVGSYEDDRYNDLLFLAKAGIKVKVWGVGPWKHKINSHPNLTVIYKVLWGEEYTRALCSFKINLCFLKKLNRDLHTSRSFEIPACGGFMVAERTVEHLELFEEGKEAVYFSDREELLRVVKYYLEHETERELIAKNGYERSLRSGYNYYERIKDMLKLAMEKNV